MPLNIGTGFPAPWIARKEEKAISVLKQWIDKSQGACYVSVSGGKDSLIVAELATRIYPDIPLVWVNQGGYLAEWDDCVELLHYWRDELKRNLIELCPPRSLWHLYLDHGLPLEENMDNKRDKMINQELLYNPLEEWEENNQIRGYAMGIRAEESIGRKKRMRSYNTFHFNKGKKLWSCCPIGWWSVQDVWLFIDRYRLKYPAMYDQDRLTIRNGCPIGTTAFNRGRLGELKKNNFAIWNQLITEYPQLRVYC